MIIADGKEIPAVNRGSWTQHYPLSPDDILPTPFSIRGKDINEFIGRDGEYQFRVQDVEMALGTQFLVRLKGPSTATFVFPNPSHDVKWKVRRTMDLGMHVDGRMKELQFIEGGPPAKMGWDDSSDALIIIEEAKIIMGLRNPPTRGLTSGTDVCATIEEGCIAPNAPGPIKVTLYRFIKKKPDVQGLVDDIERTLPPLDLDNLEAYEAAVERALKKVKTLRDVVKYVPRK